ncbi:ion channel [Polynucleobacter sp. MWH-Svant-W18]|uniref:ion channel n=1 Tax=Polynucleobacter sp. MWH-Svant-W18 TaxID=1855909 RepID=UPI001BFDE461|nr:ion channel [Polynucleobacter sp. MWH-Svant-W18]QWD78735.1 hypothetical protein C2757_04125 [Polynucleobacter sp. MWH-Svant-W18]
MTFQNPLPLLIFYANHIFGEKIDVFIITAILIFSLHSFFILLVANRFQYFVNSSSDSSGKYFRFIVYTIAMLFIMMSHLMDLLYFSYVMDCMKVFSDPLTAFYFVGEMYTTLGYGNYQLGPEWRGLPFVIGFTGLFSASISGAGLFTMLQYLGKSPFNKSQ